MVKYLPKVVIPSEINYQGLFTSFNCNYACSWCLNDPEQADHRSDLFPMFAAKDHVGLSVDDWIHALTRFNKTDIPFTWCGGEPSIFNNGVGLARIIEAVDNYADVLTNFATLKPYKVLSKDHRYKLQRPAPYPSIRVSYHPAEANRVHKGKGFQDILDKCYELQSLGFDISPDMSVSDVGVYMVGVPGNQPPEDDMWKGKIPFEVKEYLGRLGGVTHGTYAYPHAVDLVSSGVWPTTLSCKCLTRELLVAPDGAIHACHTFLYNAWAGKQPRRQFEELKKLEFRFTEFGNDIYSGDPNKPVAHILDPELDLSILGTLRDCHSYGECAFCDCKLKQTHFKEGSEYTRDAVYSSVRIESVQWPEELKYLIK